VNDYELQRQTENGQRNAPFDEDGQKKIHLGSGSFSGNESQVTGFITGECAGTPKLFAIEDGAVLLIRGS
jgi:hypothetical protein